MSIFEAITSLTSGGSSSAAGSRCGACAAKDAQITALKSKIELLAAVINQVRQIALLGVVGSEFQIATDLGHGAYARNKLARKILKITGWV